MKSYETIAQEVLERRNEHKVLQAKRRRKMVLAVASVCLVLMSGVGIWKFSGWNTLKKQQEKWPEKEIYVEGNTEAAIQETGYIPRWNEMKISQQYSEVEYAGARYFTKVVEIAADQVEHQLGNAKLSGYDIYEDITYEVVADIYKIKGISEECAVALQFEGNAGWHGYVNSYYVPETLGDLVADLNLQETLSFGSAWYDWWDEDKKHYLGMVEFPEVDDAVIWEMLLADLSVENVYDGQSMYDRALGISVNIPLLGYENISLAVTWDGYLTTNILNTGKAFFIGTEKTDAFIQYVLEECEGHRNVYVYDEEPMPEVEEELKEEIVEVYTEGYEPEETVKYETEVEESTTVKDVNTGAFTPAVPPMSN